MGELEHSLHITPTSHEAGRLEIHESAAAAGCYTFVEESIIVDEYIDPGLLRDIRSSVPRYVPLLARRLYRTPAGADELHTYHVIGMYIPDPREEYEADYVRVDRYPKDFPFDPRKIQTLRTLWAPWPKDSLEFSVAAPPAEVEFGPWVAESMKRLKKLFDGVISLDSETGRTKQITTTRDTLNEILDAEEKRDAELVASAMKEARYRMRHNWRWFKEAADKERLVPEPPDDASRPKTFDLKG